MGEALFDHLIAHLGVNAHEREVEEHAGGRARQVRRAGEGWKAYVPARKQGGLFRGGIFCSVPLYPKTAHLAQWSDAFCDCRMRWLVVVLFSMCVGSVAFSQAVYGCCRSSADHSPFPLAQ